MEHVTYTKINTLYKRNERGNIMIGEYSLPEFIYLKDLKWHTYEKIDGTNMSIYWNGHEMEIHGKSDNASIPNKLRLQMESMIDVEKLKKAFPLKYDENGNEMPMQVIIYGEGFGAGIQKGGGRYISKGTSFKVFDINIDGWWLHLSDVNDICGKLGLETAPYLGTMTITEAEEMVKNGFKSLTAEDETFNAEGVVMRPLVQLFNRRGERIMVKIKTIDYRKLENTKNN